MNLAEQFLKQIGQPGLNRDEQAILRCRLARELEQSGSYEAARGAIGDLWQRIGEAPSIEHLQDRTVAEVLLRVGVLTGWIGSDRQITGAQEIAKNLIGRSLGLFESLGDKERVAEAQVELAYCYWREGAHDEARVLLHQAIGLLAPDIGDLRAKAVLRSAIVERSALRYSDALRILIDNEPLFGGIGNYLIKGGYHNELGLVLKNIGAAEKRQDYLDRAFVEYAAASYHFEQAGHMRYRANVENNLGFLFFKAGKFKEAHEHLERARRLHASIKNSVNGAQTDETRARVFLAEGRNVEAEKAIFAAVRTLESGDHQALLAEALTTYGTVLARLARPEQAKHTLQRAIEIAHQAGDMEGAGLAALTLIEELSEHLTGKEMSLIFERAGQFLAESTDSAILLRIRDCALKVVANKRKRLEEFSAPNFIHASKKTDALLRNAHRISTSEGAVLITGETGTGKEILARLIHNWSGRVGAFVPVNCGALVDALIESLLFGHVKGSFTDAIKDHPGAVRQAAGGTLFLDEIAELSIGNQSKVLRLVEHGEIHSIGAPLPEQVDVRVIAATNTDLRELVDNKRFREDLFYRLQTFSLNIPPLRERPEDIIAIAEHFIRAALEKYSKEVIFTPEALTAMKSLPLKGNARELYALIERTVITAADGTVIGPEAIETVALRQTQKAGFAFPWEGFSLKEEVRLFEERFIELALKEAKGMITVAARLLGFSHHETLNYRIKNRNKELQSVRKPVEKRKRSIIRQTKK